MMQTPPPLPGSLGEIAKCVTTPIISLHFVAGLEIARHLAWLIPPPELNGRRFAITVSDLRLRSVFCCEAGRFRPVAVPKLQAPADLELAANLADFLSLLRGSTDADTLFFQRRLQIAGDTELGLLVKNWLDTLDRPRWLQDTFPF